jgi:hypothetical protein
MAAAEVEIIYKAQATSLKDTVNEVNKANDAVVVSAQESSKKVADTYKSAGKSIAAAFSGTEVKKALADQNKAFDDLNKKGVPLTRVLRGLRNDLNALEEAGKGGTAEFKKLIIEAARLEDQIGDTRARVSNLASDTFKFDAAVQATQGLAAGFEIAQGAAALFGSESEELQKNLLKVQAATAIANGVQQISNLLLEESKIKTLVLTNAQAAYGLVVGTTTGALKVFRLALAATGIGLLVIGVIALIQNFDKVKKVLSNAIPGFKQVSEAIGSVIDTIKEFVGASDEADKAAASFESAAKKQTAAADAVVERIERQIDIEKSAGRNTIALEIQKEQAVIDANRAIIADYVKKAGTLSKLSDEEKAKSKEINDAAVKEVFDASAKIIVIRNNVEREATEKAQEAAKKRAEAEKKAAEDVAKARENLAKAELEIFQEQLDEREKVLNESNNKIAELQKTFDDARFAGNLIEEKKLSDSIAAIKENAVKQIAVIDQKALDDKAAKEKEAAEKAKQDAEKAAEDRSKLILAGLDDQINVIQTLEIIEGSSLERRIKLIELEAKKRIEAAQGSATAIALINAQTEEAIREERRKTTQQTIDDALEIADQTVAVINTILDFQKQASENRINDITATKNVEIEAINQTLDTERDKQKQREAAELRASKRINEEKTKQAKRDKAQALFQAGIDLAVSILKTGAQLGYPAAIPFQVVAGIVGAVQIAAIASKPIPKFKKGGIVGGQSHEAGGTMIEAEKGEFVVNRSSVARHRDALDAMNRSSAAFKKYVDERYVRPALMDYASKNKGASVTVNASLNSKSMEREIKGLRKDLKGKSTVVNINSSDSRYEWHRN